MGTIAQKLTHLLNTKDQIRAAMESKGVTVPAGTPFGGYPELIQKMQAGGRGAFGAEAAARGTVASTGKASAAVELLGLNMSASAVGQLRE